MYHYKIPGRHIIMSRQPKGRGDRLLLVRHSPVGVGFLSAHCLPNHWVDFDQTGTDTLLGRGKEVIRYL